MERNPEVPTSTREEWEHDIEFFHQLKIPNGKSFTELLLKTLRYILQHTFSVFGAETSVLLMLNDYPSDLPLL